MDNMEPNGTIIVYVWVKNPYGYNNGVPKTNLKCSNNYVIRCFWNILKLVSMFFFDGFNPKKAFLTNGDWTETDTLQRGTKPTVSWGDAM